MNSEQMKHWYGVFLMAGCLRSIGAAEETAVVQKYCGSMAEQER
jgi:hypothetical protein